MTSNYLKTSWRSLKKRWPFTITNILGLSIGTASFLFLIAYTKYEESFDSYHKNHDQLFRIVFERYSGSELKTKSKYNVPGIADKIKEEITGVDEVSRYFALGASAVKYKAKTIEEPNLRYVDPDFLSMFSFEIIKGDKKTALKNPYSLVLTKSSALKLFGNEDPIGKELEVASGWGTKKFTVTGIFEDPPKNTSFNFKILCSISAAGWENHKDFLTNWKGWMFPTYIKLNNNSNINVIKDQFPSFVKKYKSYSAEKDITWKFSFQNIKDINLKSGYEEGVYDSNKKEKAVNFLKIIAILIITISWINYINLSTSSSNERAKEIGVRKAIGAKKNQIIKQFLLEVGIINLLATFLALIIVFIATNILSKVLHLDYSYEMFRKPIFWIYTVLIFIIGTLISGLYPAFVMSNFKPAVVLKSKNTTTSTSTIIRKLLIGTQFLVSILLICNTVIIISQNNYMKNQDLGININDIVILKKPQITPPWIFKKKVKDFKSELEKVPSVVLSSASFAIPSIETAYLSVELISGENKNTDRHVILPVDHDYIPLYKIGIIAGRNFDEQRKIDENAAVISKQSVKKLGFSNVEEAIGKEISIEGKKNNFKIIGVFKDYYHFSLQNKQYPYILIHNKYSAAPNYISVKVDGANSINDLKKVYKNFFPNDLFNYYIFREKYNLQYVAEDRYQNIFFIFSFLTIFLASIGVIGVSSYFALLKNKEIAIRKVFGAEKNNILWILSKEFVFVLGIAIILSIPIIIYTMNNWLNNFPNRINISIWHLLIGIMIVATITYAIVRINLIKSLRNRPVKALKTI